MNFAIIGAGAAGLAAAQALRQQRPDCTITLFEKSRGLGGRVATRRRDGYVFDPGTQYLSGSEPDFTRLLTETLPHEQLHDIGLPVWTFDGVGTVAEGDPQQNNSPKWVYRDGLNRFGKLLCDGLDVRRQVRVGALAQQHGGWQLRDVDGNDLGSFDAVLLTPPAPQSSELLRNSALDDALRGSLLAELDKARYRRCISFALAYDRLLPRPFYALVNSDRQHPIAWLGLEHLKHPDRCPPGHSLLLPQMAADWSMEHWETPLETLQPIVQTMVGTLLGEDLDAPLWCDVQRWRFSQPDSGAEFETLNNNAAGLFFAGDYTAGKGRVHLAVESGWRVAALLAAC